MNGREFQRREEAIATLVDALTDQFAVELEQVLKLLTAKARTLIRQMQTNADGRIVASQQNLALALALRTDLANALREAGYVDMARAAVNTPLDEIAATLLKGNPAIQDAMAIGRLNVDTLVALKELRLAQLLHVGEDIGIQLWRVVVDGVLGLRPVTDLVLDIADALESSEKFARVVYDTAISTYSRQVDQLGSSGEADELFFYVGPIDTKVREFCLERVGKVFTRAEIDAMDNEQLPNVMLTGGGYNCRHAFRRVSPLDTELRNLPKGERHPAVQGRLEDSDLVGATA